LENIVQSKTKPVLARAIATTPEALIITTEAGSVSIPWDRCSERLAIASFAERTRAELSPSGYGIHWPLIDEDLVTLHDIPHRSSQIQSARNRPVCPKTPFS
jgi:hypothetical protein